MKKLYIGLLIPTLVFSSDITTETKSAASTSSAQIDNSQSQLLELTALLRAKESGRKSPSLEEKVKFIIDSNKSMELRGHECDNPHCRVKETLETIDKTSSKVLIEQTQKGNLDIQTVNHLYYQKRRKIVDNTLTEEIKTAVDEQRSSNQTGNAGAIIMLLNALRGTNSNL